MIQETGKAFCVGFEFCRPLKAQQKTAAKEAQQPAICGFCASFIPFDSWHMQTSIRRSGAINTVFVADRICAIFIAPGEKP